MYICVCAAVKQVDIEKELHNGATLKDLQNKLGVGVNCCMFLESLKKILNDKYTDEPLTKN